MNTNRIIVGKTGFLRAGLAALMVWAMLAAGLEGRAQTTAANLSPDLQEIVKFAQAHMSDDVILAYIKNSGKSYTLSGDDMIYLTSQGVSQPVLSALLQTKGAAPASVPPPAAAPMTAPTVAPPPAFAPTPAPVPAYAPPPVYSPPPGLVDVFNSDAGLNPSVWAVQTPLVQTLAQWNASVSMPPRLGFSPSGMQMSGVNGPGQFTGVQSVGVYAAPFTLTARVSGLEAEGIPFEIYLVSPDLRQWLSVAGHLGGAGRPREGVEIRTPFGRIGERSVGPSPEHGVWANWTGSAQPISALGTKIYPAPIPGVPYTINMTVGPDGMGSVSFQDPGGVTLGALNAMPVGTGPFNVVLASHRAGPTFANWQSVQLTSLGAPPPMTEPPPTPTLDYFQQHLTPYGQWIDVPGVGPAWIPAEANVPGWRPYMDAGHWEYTDAGWFWQSDYPWGDIGFHYGRWIANDYTGGRWAWAPGYDWAPSWVVWRDGPGAMGWAPMPWGVEYHAGVGLFWHGGLVVEGSVGFGLGFDAFIFVGPDHFWGGDYRRNSFPPDRAREFYAHSTFHAGYQMEGGHLHAEGLGRDHVAAITHHDVVVHKVAEERRAEEKHDFAKRTEEHKELTRPPARVEEKRAPTPAERGGREATPERTEEKATPGRPGTTAAPGRGTTTAPGRGTPPGQGSKPSGNGSEKKPD